MNEYEDQEQQEIDNSIYNESDLEQHSSDAGIFNDEDEIL